MTIKLHLFGPPRLDRDGVAISLNHRKAWALLAYLAVTAQPHGRDTLATLLWPDYGQTEARSHLRRELARLRDLLGADQFVTDREQIALAAPEAGPHPRQVDVTTFLRHNAAAALCTHAPTTACPTCLPHLVQTAACYTDHFLAGFTLPDSPGFDEWCFFQREQLSASQGRVLERLTSPPARSAELTSKPLLTGEGSSLEQAIQYARRWVAHDPLHEPAQRALIALYAQSGQPTAARRQYESCLRLLKDELGVPPEAETTALYAAIRTQRTPDRVTGGQEDRRTRGQDAEPSESSVGRLSILHPVILSSPHPVTPSPPPIHALPTHATLFIGRQAELMRYQQLLATSGMAVISGMPGVGKSALALALAQQVAARDAIFWHTCQPEEGVDGVIWRLAAFLAERGQPVLWQWLQRPLDVGGRGRVTPPPLGALIDYLAQLLQQGAYLLCLDDLHHWEHEAGAAELLRRLVELAQAAKVRLIFTSPHKLTVTGAPATTPLSGMTLTDTRDLLRQHNLTLPADLLHQLHAETEGNSQFLVLTIQALQRTADPARLLDQLAASEDLEQHLLRLVNNLLSAEEHAVMAAIAILEGHPGTRPALEAIAEADQVRDALLRLSARYLVHTTPSDGGPCYHAHALVQKFFYNGLNRRVRQIMHRRAAAYYATEEPDALLAAQHYLRAAAPTEAAQLITSNLQLLIGQGRIRALQRSLTRLRQPDLEPLLWAAVCVARGQVYALLGEWEPAQAAYAEASARLLDLPNAPVLRGELFLGLAELAEQTSFAEAKELVEQGLAALGDGDPLLAASLHLKLAGVLAALGDYAAARQAAHTGMALLPPTPHMLQVAAHENLGVIDFYTGQMAQAAEHWTRGLAICRRLPHPFKAVDLLNNLGAYHLVAGTWAEAGRLLEEGLAEAQKLGTARHQAFFHLNLGILRTWQSNDDAAETHLQKLAQSTGEYASNARYSLADLRLRQGRLQDAALLLDEAAGLITEAGAAYQWPELYRLCAQLLLAQGEDAAALTAVQQSIQQAQAMHMTRDEAIAHGILGQLLARQGDAAADDAFRRSLALLADEPYEQARTTFAWGLAQQQRGDGTAGAALIETAYQTFVQLGAAREVQAVAAQYTD